MLPTDSKLSDDTLNAPTPVISEVYMLLNVFLQVAKPVIDVIQHNCSFVLGIGSILHGFVGMRPVTADSPESHICEEKRRS